MNSLRDKVSEIVYNLVWSEIPLAADRILALPEIKEIQEKAVNCDLIMRGLVVEEGCERCDGSGWIKYNPNLNPNSFPSEAFFKCKYCEEGKSTGLATAEEVREFLERMWKGDGEWKDNSLFILKSGAILRMEAK